MNAPDLRIIDASYYLPHEGLDPREEYDRHHIPGAVFFDIDEIADSDSSLPHMLPSPQKFSSRVRKLGLGDGLRFVVYDQRGIWSAPRVWWTFRYFGHRDVAILDGGLPKWMDEGRPVDEDEVRPEERHFTARMDAFMLRDLDQMQSNLLSGREQVLDASPAARFRGEAAEPRAGLRKGHIPGSLNPAEQRADGRRRPLLSGRGGPAPALRGQRLSFSKPVVTTCGSGITAAILALGLEMAGHRGRGALRRLLGGMGIARRHRSGNRRRLTLTREELPKGYAIRPYAAADEAALLALWEACGLVTPWNDPPADLRLANDCAATASLFVAIHGVRLVGTIMAGYDGHRGWLYYLGVAEEARGRGIGGALVKTAEAWLAKHDVPKVQLIVRETNLAARDFYARLGYHPNPCSIMQRWLTERATPPVPGSDDGLLRFTVTYLEMTERPAMPPPPPPARSKVALMRAMAPTAAFYRFLYDRVGKSWLWWERKLLDDEALTAVIHDERIGIYVLYVEGVPAGFAELDCREAPDILLSYFGLMPEFIGRGLGPYLLYSAIDIAWSHHQPERLLVNTNTLDHPRALPLYQRFGFRPVRRQEEEIVDPRRSGLIPPWEL